MVTTNNAMKYNGTVFLWEASLFESCILSVFNIQHCLRLLLYDSLCILHYMLLVLSERTGLYRGIRIPVFGSAVVTERMAAIANYVSSKDYDVAVFQEVSDCVYLTRSHP